MPDIFVLDCSVAAKWVLPEPDRAPALALLEQYASGKVQLIAPDILLAEFASLVSKHHRRKLISAEQANGADANDDDEGQQPWGRAAVHGRSSNR